MANASPVSLPKKIWEQTVFRAHGKSWRILKEGNDAYSFCADAEPTVRRFGTAKEIAEDIGIVLECGALPRAKNSMA